MRAVFQRFPRIIRDISQQSGKKIDLVITGAETELDKTMLDQLNDRCMQLLAEVKLEQFADELAVNLPYGRKRALEIAATLAMEPELMLLDEPTQGMGHEDVGHVTDLIKQVSAGRTIMMVEHNMKVVSTIADTITVLQHGAVLAEGDYAAVSSNPQVMEAYMGTTAGELQGAH